MRITKSFFLVAIFSCVSAHVLADGSTFSGTYRVNGKDAKLNHMTVKPGGCMFGDGVAFVLSEKEVNAKPGEKFSDVAFNAQMGGFGDALAVQICSSHDTWKVENSNFSHSGLNHTSGTWVGQLKVEGLTVANGEYSGHLVSIKDAKLFDDNQLLEVNITFNAKP
jgi:hypothetical protein